MNTTGPTHSLRFDNSAELAVIDVLIPVHNEESCLPELLRRLSDVKESMATKANLQCIFIDDGSKDQSDAIIRRYASDHHWVKLVSLSRNFGHQKAVTAGLDYSTGDYAVLIDADLQDPPELIPAMYAKAKEGFEVVFGQRILRRGETVFKRLTAKAFYLVINRMCKVNIPLDTGDFRLVNKKVVAALHAMKEEHRFLRGMVPWTGFRSVAFPYERDARFAGETKYPFKKMLLFSLDAIFSFSNYPIRFITLMGLLCVFAGILGAAFIAFLRLFAEVYVSGVPAIILTIVIMSGMQILMLGITGEYVGRIDEEVKRRPL